MFLWGILFLMISLVAAAFGFGGLANESLWTARSVFVAGLVFAAMVAAVNRELP